MKKVIEIVAAMAALLAWVTALCFLLVGPEIYVMPKGMPTIIGCTIGIYIGMRLLNRRKTLQGHKTVKPYWLIVALAMLCLLTADVPAVPENIYAALLLCTVMLLGSIINRSKVHIAVFSVLVVSLIGAVIFYRMGERVDWGVIAEYHQQAEQGDIDIQCVLGCLYYYGRGVVKDDAEAVKWLLLAAEQGQVDALYQLGLCYFLGAGVSRNEDEAIRSYWRAFQGGHAGASFVLHKLELEDSEEYRQMKMRTNYGNTYVRNGKPFDIALPTTGGNLGSSPNQLPRVSRNGIFEAFDIMHWDEQLTHLSYPTVRLLAPNKTSYYYLKRDTIYISPNCTQFAFDHELGRKLRFDIEKEWVETAKQHRIAAERGDAGAQCLLALCYVYGNGVPHDYSEAARWFRKSAEQGNAMGQYELGVCYRNGGGVSQDDAEAVKWITKAAEQGLDRAQSNLGLYYLNGIGVPQDKQKAIQWLLKAVDQENAQAQCILGECFYNGYGVPQNKEEAIKLYRESAEQGYAGAQFNLGEYYFLGEGVAQDKKEAVTWLQKAAGQGNEKAANLLREIEQE